MKPKLLITIQNDDASFWRLTYNTFDPSHEGLRETLCALGNGYCATRGAAYESPASNIHYPGTYMAGVYNKIPTCIADRHIFNEDMVNCPNWLLLQFRIGTGAWIDFSNSRILTYYQELNMHSGILFRRVRLKDKAGRISKVESWRIVSMADRHLAAIKYVITPENYEGRIRVRSSLDGSVQNTGVARYRQLKSKHLRVSHGGAFGRNGMYLLAKTSQSKIAIVEATKIHVYSGDSELKPCATALKKEKERISYEFELDVKKNHHYTIEKIISLYTSCDKGVRSPLSRALKCVKRASRFDVLAESHRRAWEALWQKFDITVDSGNPFFQKVLRLHIFHLLQTASYHNKDIDAGIPARGLHGEAYRGHIFWDELFVMHFFGLHAPEISGALLLYRYRRLKQARAYAKKNGYAGAMFPWQSGITGEEETQIIHLNPLSGRWGPDHSRIQRHVSFAIAYNVWQHWRFTRDKAFLCRYGAEMLLSIAQFGASLARYDPVDKRYHTNGLMGPDEFHEKLPGRKEVGFRDNAYTNLLIVWTIMKAKEALRHLPFSQRVWLLKKIGLSSKELARWETITRTMNIVMSDDDIIAQFDGYFNLKELDWKAYRAKYDRIQRMDRILKSEGKSPNEYKVAKQADALMIFYLLPLDEIQRIFHRLGYPLDHSILKKNYEYYIRRTSHGSTLSKVVHCYIAHLLGKSREASKWFLKVLQSDIYDTQGGTTPEGIHAGVMGGSLTVVIKGFAGITILEDRIAINPNLPKGWNGLSFNFQWRKNRISLLIAPGKLTIRISGPHTERACVPIAIYGTLYHCVVGRTYTISLKKESKSMK